MLWAQGLCSPFPSFPKYFWIRLQFLNKSYLNSWFLKYLISSFTKLHECYSLWGFFRIWLFKRLLIICSVKEARQLLTFQICVWMVSLKIRSIFFNAIWILKLFVLKLTFAPETSTQLPNPFWSLIHRYYAVRTQHTTPVVCGITTSSHNRSSFILQVKRNSKKMEIFTEQGGNIYRRRKYLQYKKETFTE